MSKPNLDELQATYKQAVDQWVTAIRAEEALATPDHSETAMEHWDSADFGVQDAAKRAKEARDAYKEGLRQLQLRLLGSRVEMRDGTLTSVI